MKISILPSLMVDFADKLCKHGRVSSHTEILALRDMRIGNTSIECNAFTCMSMQELRIPQGKDLLHKIENVIMDQKIDCYLQED